MRQELDLLKIHFVVDLILIDVDQTQVVVDLTFVAIDHEFDNAIVEELLQSTIRPSRGSRPIVHQDHFLETILLLD